MNLKNALNLSKSSANSQDCGNEKRVEMDRKVTELLHVKYDVEREGYYVTLWGMAISPMCKTQEEAIGYIQRNDTDMLVTAMYGIASQLIKENNEKSK